MVAVAGGILIAIAAIAALLLGAVMLGSKDAGTQWTGLAILGALAACLVKMFFF